ncbi:hypothetical protein FOCC_FOCC015780 [Frankliniella occidentalis]|nr:hypothetical protein FOCC_FOCC015780 [Frankliniella occidentalis]
MALFGELLGLVLGWGRENVGEEGPSLVDVSAQAAVAQTVSQADAAVAKAVASQAQGGSGVAESGTVADGEGRGGRVGDSGAGGVGDSGGGGVGDSGGSVLETGQLGVSEVHARVVEHKISVQLTERNPISHNHLVVPPVLTFSLDLISSAVVPGPGGGTATRAAEQRTSASSRTLREQFIVNMKVQVAIVLALATLAVASPATKDKDTPKRKRWANDWSSGSWDGGLSSWDAPMLSHSAYAAPVLSHSAYAAPVLSHSAYAAPVVSHASYAAPVVSHASYAAPAISAVGLAPVSTSTHSFSRHSTYAAPAVHQHVELPAVHHHVEAPIYGAASYPLLLQSSYLNY